MQTIDVKKLPQDVAASAHRAWLAGLGAVAVVEENATRWLDELGKRSRDLEKKGRRQYDRLVVRGKKLETEGRRQATAARRKAEKTVDSIQEEVDERMAGLLQRLGIPHSEQIRTLAERVEELTRKVEEYQRVAGGPSVPTPAAAPARSVFHIAPHEGGWSVRREGTDTAASTHATKDEALSGGRELAQKEAPAQLVVHRLDGSVQTAYSYGD